MWLISLISSSMHYKRHGTFQYCRKSKARPMHSVERLFHVQRRNPQFIRPFRRLLNHHSKNMNSIGASATLSEPILFICDPTIKEPLQPLLQDRAV